MNLSLSVRLLIVFFTLLLILALGSRLRNICKKDANMKIRALSLPLIIFFFVLVFLPVGSQLAGIEDKTELSGVFTEHERTAFSKTSYLNGSYQTDFQNWFGLNFNFHHSAYKLYNQFRYDVFRQSNSIVISDSGIMIEQSYIDEYFRIREPDSDEYLDMLTDTIKEVKKELDLLGIPLLVLITPNQVEFIEEALPERYNWAVREDKKNLSRNIDRFLPLLDEKEIPYVNGTQILRDTEIATPLFPKTGAHWTIPAAFECMRVLVEEMDKSVPMRQVDSFSYETSHQPLYYNDQDLFRLMNVFSAEEDSTYYEVDYTVNDENYFTLPPKILYQGGSYCHQIRDLLYRQSMASFNQLFYAQWYIDAYPSGGPLDDEFNGIDLPVVLATTDFVILEVNEEFIYKMGMGFPQHLLKTLQKNVIERRYEDRYIAERKEPFRSIIGFIDAETGWAEKTAIVRLSNPHFREHGAEITMAFPQEVLDLVQSGQALTIYINNRPAMTIPFPDDTNQISILIPAEVFPEGDSGIFDIAVSSPVASEEISFHPDRSVGMQLTYIGPPREP